MALSPAASSLSPADLSRAFLGRDHWETPSAILDAVMRPRSRVAVKACHASSKTFTAADAVVLTLLAGGDVLTTAPTWEQVRTVLWGEIHRALYHLERVTGGLGAWDINQTEITTPSGAKALGLSTNEGVRFQGWHARTDSFLLLIADEAPGVRPDIFEAWEGISAGGDVRHLLLGNPVIASGYFFDIFANESPGWDRHTIDAFDTPNLRGLSVAALQDLGEAALNQSDRPYLVTRRWVLDRYREWGEDHPLWQSRVRGRFPDQSDDALISLAWLEAADKPPVYDPDEYVDAGVDVAGPGEAETTLTIVQGDAVIEQHAFADADARGRVLAALRPWTDRLLRRVAVDTIGQGHYFAEHLRDHGYDVVPINVGESPLTDEDRKRYANLKAQLYWETRERFRSGRVSGLRDRKSRAQLAGIRYKHDAHGKVVIESKEQAARRGVASPDRAESVVLAYAAQRPVDGFAKALDKTTTGYRQMSDAEADLRDMIEQRRWEQAEQEAGW